MIKKFGIFVLVALVKVFQVAFVDLLISCFRKNTGSSSHVVYQKNNGIPWTEKKSNEEEMEMAGYKRSLLKTIRKRQL